MGANDKAVGNLRLIFFPAAARFKKIHIFAVDRASECCI